MNKYIYNNEYHKNMDYYLAWVYNYEIWILLEKLIQKTGLGLNIYIYRQQEGFKILIYIYVYVYI